jgi:hypothetical protein
VRLGGELDGELEPPSFGFEDVGDARKRHRGGGILDPIAFAAQGPEDGAGAGGAVLGTSIEGDLVGRASLGAAEDVVVRGDSDFVGGTDLLSGNEEGGGVLAAGAGAACPSGVGCGGAGGAGDGPPMLAGELPSSACLVSNEDSDDLFRADGHACDGRQSRKSWPAVEGGPLGPFARLSEAG